MTFTIQWWFFPLGLFLIGFWMFGKGGGGYGISFEAIIGLCLLLSSVAALIGHFL